MLSNVIQTSAGQDSSLFLTNDSRLYIAGRNIYLIPTDLNISFPIGSFEASSDANYIISKNGEAYSFGTGNDRQLGFNDTISRDVPTPLNLPFGIKSISVGTGTRFMLFLTNTSEAVSFGTNPVIFSV